jgi:hypothetical protein
VAIFLMNEEKIVLLRPKKNVTTLWVMTFV